MGFRKTSETPAIIIFIIPEWKQSQQSRQYNDHWSCYFVFLLLFCLYCWLSRGICPAVDISTDSTIKTGLKPIISLSSQQRCSIIKGVLRNFAKFTGKHLRQSLFFDHRLRELTLSWRRSLSYRNQSIDLYERLLWKS